MITRAEMEYLAKVPARLDGIEKQLERIAKSLYDLNQYLINKK